MTSEEAQRLNDKATAGLLSTIERAQMVLMERHETLEAEHQFLRAFTMKILDRFMDLNSTAAECARILGEVERFGIGIDREGCIVDLRVR